MNPALNITPCSERLSACLWVSHYSRTECQGSVLAMSREKRIIAVRQGLRRPEDISHLPAATRLAWACSEGCVEQHIRGHHEQRRRAHRDVPEEEGGGRRHTQPRAPPLSGLEIAEEKCEGGGFPCRRHSQRRINAEVEVVEDAQIIYR